MKTIYLLLLLIISINLNAQVFAPDEAVWYYTFDPDVTLDEGYQKIEVSGDTTINEKVCKILQKTNIGYSYWDKEYYEINAGKSFVYEEDSVVYFKKDNLFYILYDFSAKVGDSYLSISFQDNCQQQFEVHIDSITEIINMGILIRKFHITLDDSIQTFFLDRIGYPSYLFSSFQIGCDILMGPHYPESLRCYTDNSIGTFDTNVVPNCDYMTSTINYKYRDKLFNIYPNPSQDQRIIQVEIFDDKIKNIAIYDLFGKKLKNYRIANELNTSISIENSGSYIICFSDKNDKILGSEKIIIK